MREIPLTRGKVAIIDDEDYDLVSRFTWHAEKNRKNWYARSYLSLGRYAKRVALHTFIMHPPEGMEVDHIDRDGLNCVRGNMRLCTHVQNTRNRPSVNATGYRGVYENTRGRFYSQIRGDDKKQICLGTFSTPEEAARAYNEAARHYHGEFATLNIME